MSVSRSNELSGLAGIAGGFAPLDSGLYVPAAYLPQGTSMPAQPGFGNNRKFWRTDLDLDVYYDGTRWLTATLYHMPLAGPLQGQTTAVQNGWPLDTAVGSPSAISRTSFWHTDYQLWLVNFYGNTLVNTTNNGTNFYTLAIVGNVTSTTYGSFTTAADTAGVWTGHVAALNAAAGSTERGVTITAARTLSPGSAYLPTGLTYRLIVT